MPLGHNISSKEEIRHILLAYVVLTVAFAVALSGGLFSGSQILNSIIALLPIVAVAVALSFILHELMHKFVAQHYGAMAEFRTSPNGLIITIVTSALGFLMAIPGATYIYSNRFTKRENGIVSLAGPLTNIAIFCCTLLLGFAIFGLPFLLGHYPANESYLETALSFLVFISVYLAFFNMLPIFPLDGSKVLAWNPFLYVPVMAIILALTVFYTGIGIWNIVIVVFIAAVFSLFYRSLI
jgi:Zn-dependent protease